MRENAYSILFWIIADILNEDHKLMFACWCLGVANNGRAISV